MEAPPTSFDTKARQIIRQQLELTAELQNEQLQLLHAPRWHVIAWVAVWLGLSAIVGKIFVA